MKAAFSALAFAGLLLLTGCDALEQLSGTDPLKTAIRDNPVDPQSVKPLSFGLDATSALVTTVRPSFRISLTGDVVSYSLQIASDSDLRGSLVLEEQGILEQVHRITKPLNNQGNYFWRVRPRFADGREGGWSDARAFKVELPVPGSLMPPKASLVSTPFPRLSWAVPLADAMYQLQLAGDEAFTDNPVILDTAQPEYQIRDALQTGAWRFWRVRVIDEGVQGIWSQPASIHVLLPEPRVQYPVKGESLHDLRLFWAVDGTVPAEAVYQVEVNPDVSFPPEKAAVAEAALSGQVPSTLTPTLAMTYFWRVRTQYAPGVWSPWSLSGQFYRDRVSRVIKLPWANSSHQVFALPDGRLRVIGNLKTGWLLTDGVLSSTVTDVQYSGGGLITAEGSIYQIENNGPGSGLLATSPEGAPLWTLPLPPNSIQGLACVADGTLYTAYWRRDTDPSLFRLQAVAPSGTVKWYYDAPYGTTTRDSVAVTSDGTACFATTNGVYAFSTTGTLLWTYPVKNAELSAGKDGSLFIVDPQATGPGLSAVDAQGSLLWSYQGSVRSTPVSDGDGNLYMALGSRSMESPGQLASLSSSGGLRWSKPWSKVFKMILGADGVLYSLDQAYPANPVIHAVNAADGTVLWTDQCFLQDGGVVDMTLGSDGTLNVLYGGHLDQISTTSLGVDPRSPWPMTGGDPLGSRSAHP